MDGEMHNHNSSMAGAVITSGIIGLVAGAAIGLLLAPRPGKETRQLIAEKARSLKSSGEEVVSAISGKVKAMGNNRHIS